MKDKAKIKEQWHLAAEPGKKGKSQWRGKTKNGDLNLHMAEERDPYLVSRLDFWQWLRQDKDFPVTPLVRGKNGDYTLNTGEHIYYAAANLKSKSLDFGDTKTATALAALLAKFHILAREFDWHSHCLPQKKPDRYISRMEKILAESEVRCNRSARLRLYWPEILTRAERSMVLLCSGSLAALQENMASQGDFAYGKIERQGFCHTDGCFRLTDLSALAEDLAVFDLWRLCRRTLAYGKSAKTVWALIQAYEAEKPLTESEGVVLYALLLFPYDALKNINATEKKEDVESILVTEASLRSFYAEIYEKGRSKQDEDSH